MPSPCIVLIAATERLHPLQRRFDPGGGDLLTFSDSDALRALRAIAERRPSIIVLEQQFSETSRGVAILDRLKTDPSLIGSEVRVVTCDEESLEAADARMVATASVETKGDQAAREDQAARAKRRAERFRVDEFVEAMVDGNMAAVVDISIEGAQVVSAAVLKPNQRVEVSLADEEAVLRFTGCVAWSAFEIPRTGGPRYRAGIQFLDAEIDALGKYSRRHRTA